MLPACVDKLHAFLSLKQYEHCNVSLRCCHTLGAARAQLVEVLKCQSRRLAHPSSWQHMSTSPSCTNGPISTHACH